jgi:hypothetical protein
MLFIIKAVLFSICVAGVAVVVKLLHERDTDA